jgi:tetratricopeptide (TPR) repeat protein
MDAYQVRAYHRRYRLDIAELFVGVKPDRLDLRCGKGVVLLTMVTAVYQRTEGNPFFLTEIIRLLATEGAYAALDNAQAALELPVPQRVRDVVTRRLQALSADCQQLLSMAAIVGREFHLQAVAAVAAQAHSPLQRPLLDLLDEALAARLIARVPQSLGHYSFAHALIRETLYEELPVWARVQMHQQPGDALEHLCWPHLEPYLTELAAHFLAAAQGGVAVEQTIIYALQAAEQATALLAYEEAANYYTQALQLLEFHPLHEVHQCDVLLALGDAQRKAGTNTEARETFERAAGCARKLGRPEHLARAALGFATGFAGISVQSGVADALLIGLLEEALTALPQADSALRARVLGRLAMELYWSSTREQRAIISQQAVEMARRLNDPATLAYTLHATLVALRGPEHPQDRLATAAEIIRLAEVIGDKELVLRGYIWRVVALLELGDIQAVDQDMAAYAQRAEELRQPLYMWVLTIWQAMRAELRGDFAAAERLAQQALAIGQRAQDADAVQCFTVQLFVIRGGRQSLHAVELPTRDFAAQYTSIPGWRSALALLYATTEREAEARRELEYFAANDFAALPRHACWMITLTNLAQVCVQLQDRTRAARLYQLLLPFAEQCVVVEPGLVCLGSVARFLGQLAMTLSRWDEAEAHFVAAVQRNTLLGARPVLAQTQRHYATMLLARQWPGDREKAMALLHQALAVGQELAMDEHIRHVQALLEQGQRQGASAHHAATLTPPTLSTTHLFRQEGDYWTISYYGPVFRLKHVRGLHYIAHLLQHPHQAWHVFDLVTLARPPASLPSAALRPLSTTSAPRSVALGDAGEILDLQARTAYKQRLQALQEERMEAQRANDVGRGATVQQEIDMLLQQLAAALGVGGRSRRAASPAERARVNVTNGIRAALTKIAASSPPLAQYLTTTIKTGLFCSYTPTPHPPMVWQF